MKNAIDVGFMTQRWHEHQEFWDHTVGLRYDHLLKLGAGMHQHRYDLHGAVCKVNSCRQPLTESASGFRSLTILGSQAANTATPDGTPVSIVTCFPDQSTRTVIDLVASDATATAEALKSVGATDTPAGMTIGESSIRIQQDTARIATGTRDGVGIRYITVQVSDVHDAHRMALAGGLFEGMAPVRVGDIAVISFVRLPDGDWIELSQRASLTGPLPDP